MTKIKLSENVTDIGAVAFNHCSGLQSVSLPGSVTAVNDSVFCFCSGLKSVTLADSVISIGEDAFHGCTALTSIVIPDAVTEIGEGAFSCCDHLSDVKTGKSILCLAQPKITKRGNVAKGTKLTWSKSTGAASYRVYLKSGSSWKQLASVKTNTYTAAKLKSGTTYTYTVRAVSKDGKTLSAYNTSGWKQKFIAAPALPTLKNTKNGVQIAFKKVVGAEKYRIFRKTGKGKWVKLTDTTKLTYVDKTAKNGKTYSYTVRCISKDGKAYTSACNTAGKAIKCRR